MHYFSKDLFEHVRLRTPEHAGKNETVGVDWCHARSSHFGSVPSLLGRGLYAPEMSQAYDRFFLAVQILEVPACKPLGKHHDLFRPVFKDRADHRC